MAQEKKNYQGFAVTSMVLGISSIVLVLWLGFVLGILAIIFGAIVLKRVKRNGMAITGLITGIVGTVLSLLVFALIIFTFITSVNEPTNSSTAADAYTVEQQAELFWVNEGYYPSYSQLEAEASKEGVEIDDESSTADIIYIPCYGEGGIIWYWQDDTEEYISRYMGNTDNCEWKTY